MRPDNLHQLVKPAGRKAVVHAVESDENYLFMRAEQEEAMAAEAPNQAARDCHLHMARLYRQSAIDNRPRSLGDHDLTVPPIAEP